MDREQAEKILTDSVIKSDGGLYSGGWYISWPVGSTEAVLDGEFTAEDLEAIAWWMKNAK